MKNIKEKGVGKEKYFYELIFFEGLFGWGGGGGEAAAGGSCGLFLGFLGFLLLGRATSVAAEGGEGGEGCNDGEEALEGSVGRLSPELWVLGTLEGLWRILYLGCSSALSLLLDSTDWLIGGGRSLGTGEFSHNSFPPYTPVTLFAWYLCFPEELGVISN
jgi:hypothetical protein